MSILTSIFGNESTKIVKKLEKNVEKINALEPRFAKLTSDEFAKETALFKERLEKGETLNDILCEAFALVREAAKRTLNQRHYDVQLIGGMVLHGGMIAEMKTGEGKTLVGTLPVYLNALTGKGVHVVTVNDYLSRRDAVWMGQVYALLGLSVGVINHESSFLYDRTHVEADEKRDEVGEFKVVYEFLRPVSRKEAYEADITYGTNNEFGFDYLRDNIAYEIYDVVQREHNFAIVDEIDSILIDESRTPLIISAPAQESEDMYHNFARMVSSFKEGDDYTLDEKHKQVALTDAGITKAEKMLNIDNLYTNSGMKFVHHLETAVRAKGLYVRDRDYVVKDGEVIIVDEFTGRLQPGRRWSEGLHQAIEAKEGVKVERESRTVASITFQNYFRFYKKLAGMTGTAKTSSEEFYKVYGLPVIEIPTHRVIRRIDSNDLIFQTEKGKFQAIAKKVKELHTKGQPVLIGTVSIEKNELLSAYLKREGIPHTILNAKNHESEGEIVAQAGRPGMVTIATNMAGRGVDIKLGGVPPKEEDAKKVHDAGGLFVLGTERHEARRIDNQLRGRSGRQGDPGETQFFVSLEDSLMRIFAPDFIKTMMGRFGIPEDEPIETRMISRALETAQTKIEGFNFDARKSVLEYDNVLNHQRKSVYEKRRIFLMGTDEELEKSIDEFIGPDEEARNEIKLRRELLGDVAFFDIARKTLLQVIDMLWMEHLEAMDYLRNSVNLRAYGQRDPLVEYKKEGLRLYREMQEGLRQQITGILRSLNAPNNKITGESPMKEKFPEPVVVTINPHDKKVGRNDACPCGSGKKYKKCGELNTEEHQQLMKGK